MKNCAGERGHGEIEAADAQARQTEEDAHERRHDAAAGEASRIGMPGNAQHEVVRRERADRHERRRAERDLAGVAGQDVEAERGEREDQERDQDRREEVRRRREGNDDEGEHEDDAIPIRS
jgi:hypothetical protein